VAAGSSTTFPIWLLAGASPTNINVAVQCTGGPAGTSCGLDHNSSILTGDSFGPARDKIVVTVSVPAKSALAFRGTRSLWWAAFAFGILLVQKKRRTVLRFAAIATLLVMSILMISCGGNSRPGVTGSSTLVITASPSPGTPHSLTVPLVVQ